MRVMSELSELVVDAIIFMVGALTMGFISLQEYMESWQRGYDDAKKIYSNWDRGYDDGFKDGFRCGLKEKNDE